MPFFGLVLAGIDVTLSGTATQELTGTDSLLEAASIDDDSKVSNWSIEGETAGIVTYIGFATSLLIRLSDDSPYTLGEPEAVPSGFTVINARIRADGPGLATFDQINWYYNGSFIPALESGSNEESENLNPITNILLASYGVRYDISDTIELTTGGGLDYLAIIGEYELSSATLSIAPKTEIIPDDTILTITDLEGGLTSIPGIRYSYRDELNDLITGDITTFLSQNATEITFQLPALTIADGTVITIELLPDEIFVDTIIIESAEPDILIPDGDGELDTETGLLIGIGFGGIRLSGSGLAGSNEIIWPEIDGGIDFGGGVDDSLNILGNISGIYTLVKDKTHDTLYDRAPMPNPVNVKIPDPFIRTGYAGK